MITQLVKPSDQIENTVAEGITIPMSTIEKDKYFFNKEMDKGISRRYFKGRVFRAKLVHADETHETFRQLCPQCHGDARNGKVVCFSCRGTGVTDQVYKVPILSHLEIREDLYYRIKEKYARSNQLNQLSTLDTLIVNEDIEELLREVLK